MCMGVGVRGGSGHGALTRFPWSPSIFEVWHNREVIHPGCERIIEQYTPCFACLRNTCQIKHRPLAVSCFNFLELSSKYPDFVHFQVCANKAVTSQPPLPSHKIESMK